MFAYEKNASYPDKTEAEVSPARGKGESRGLVGCPRSALEACASQEQKGRSTDRAKNKSKRGCDEEFVGLAVWYTQEPHYIVP